MLKIVKIVKLKKDYGCTQRPHLGVICAHTHSTFLNFWSICSLKNRRTRTRARTRKLIVYELKSIKVQFDEAP